MDKTALLMKLRAAQRTLDEVMGAVLAMEDTLSVLPQSQAQTPQDMEPLLDIKQVADHFSVKKNTIYDWIREGDFPKGFYIRPREQRWNQSDIETWITSKRGCDTHYSERTSHKTRRRPTPAASGF